MSIRSQFRRALRKSGASTGRNPSSPTTTLSSSTSQSSDTSMSLHKTSSILSRALTWAGRERDSEPKKKQNKKNKRPVHPSEKPLTAQNLRHQEMLSHFTMTFGASDPSQIDRLSFVGISPCCTRTPSIDGDAMTSESWRRDITTIDDDDDEMVPP